MNHDDLLRHANEREMPPLTHETDWCSDCQTRHAPHPERRCNCGSAPPAPGEHWKSCPAFVATPTFAPIVLRYDVEVTTADGAVLAGWLELPTGAHTPEQAWTIKRNIFNLDWSDARITEMSETRQTASLARSGQQDTTEAKVCPTCGSDWSEELLPGCSDDDVFPDRWHTVPPNPERQLEFQKAARAETQVSIEEHEGAVHVPEDSLAAVVRGFVDEAVNAALRGAVPPNPERCPTCGSDDPAVFLGGCEDDGRGQPISMDLSGNLTYPQPDPFHAVPEGEK